MTPGIVVAVTNEPGPDPHLESRADPELVDRHIADRHFHLTASSTSSWADPMCSIERDPRRQDHTTCTAVAPEAVFTVRM